MAECRRAGAHLLVVMRASGELTFDVGAERATSCSGERDLVHSGGCRQEAGIVRFERVLKRFLKEF
jgi:hypothetical protein